MYKVDKKKKKKNTGERSKPCKRRTSNTGGRGWLLVLWTVRGCLVLVERCLKRGPCTADEKITAVKPGLGCTWSSLSRALASDNVGSFSLALEVLGSVCSGTRDRTLCVGAEEGALCLRTGTATTGGAGTAHSSPFHYYGIMAGKYYSNAGLSPALAFSRILLVFLEQC